MEQVIEVPFENPYDVFVSLPLDVKDLIFCDGEGGGERSRYSYITCSCFGKVENLLNGAIRLSGFGDGEAETKSYKKKPQSKHVLGEQDIRHNADFFHVVQEKMSLWESEFSSFDGEALPPFRGGCFFALGYDRGEESSAVALPVASYFSSVACFYDVVLAFDLVLKKTWIIVSCHKERETIACDLVMMFKKALQFVSSKKDQRNDTSTIGVEGDGGEALNYLFEWQAECSPNQHQERVTKVVEHILSGDIFQANVSQEFSALCPSFSSFSERMSFLKRCYGRLRVSNPAPYGCFVDLGDVCLLSSSPECFIKGEKNRLWTDPIKGTCLAVDDPIEDQKIKEELRGDPKNRSENIMIVDLLRNDFSKVCDPESVQVDKLCEVETFRSLHHMVSRVSGTLKEGLTFMDALRACFPGGSITGAPKIRAMEIIADLETKARGYYCGSFGFVGRDGFFDSNILIRTLIQYRDIISFRVGGGIVARSNSYDEYVETLVKGQRIFKAFCSKDERPHIRYKGEPIYLEDYL